ncbi:hypothetical protein GCM10022393_15300 [Aquimarina addita]|uniref:Uncharacterized protein n=1 Tax=Aquimarina addita TaxID=870485 RepID=A0ABP7XHG5_9FLAO
MQTIFKLLFKKNKKYTKYSDPYIYSRCRKLNEDYSEEQLITMFGLERTEFIKNNPEEWFKTRVH